MQGGSCRDGTAFIVLIAGRYRLLVLIGARASAQHYTQLVHEQSAVGGDGFHSVPLISWPAQDSQQRCCGRNGASVGPSSACRFIQATRESQGRSGIRPYPPMNSRRCVSSCALQLASAWENLERRNRRPVSEILRLLRRECRAPRPATCGCTGFFTAAPTPIYSV